MRRIGRVAVAMLVVATAGSFGCRRHRPSREPLPAIVVAEVPAEPVPDAMPWVGDEGTDAYGTPHRTASPIGYRALLRGRRFDQLTRYFDDLDRAAAADFHREHWPIDALQAFDTADPTLSAPLDEWVRTSPNSFAPYAARATHLLAASWFYRGHEFVDRTDPARLEAMNGLIVDAERDVAFAFAHGPRSSAVARLAIRVAQLGGGLGPMRARVDAALAACPGCYRLRYAQLLATTPRWRGSIGAMNELVDEARSHLAINPRLALLASVADEDRSNMPGSLDERLAAADAALARGETAEFLKQRAQILYLLDRDDEALALVDRALVLRPAYLEAIELRGRIDRDLHRWLAAAEDMLLTARLEPVDANRNDRMNWAATMAAAEAYVRHITGDDATARRMLEVARSLDAQNAEATTVGALLDAGGEPSVLAREAAVRAAPDDREARRALDEVLMARRLGTRVIALWDDYLSRHPDDAIALFERAGTESQLRFMAHARRDARRACAMGHRPACTVVIRDTPHEEI